MATDISAQRATANRNDAARGARTAATLRGRWNELTAAFGPDSVIALILLFAGVLIVGIWLATMLRIQVARDEAVAGVVRQNDNFAVAFEEHIDRTIKGIDLVVRFLRHEHETRSGPINISVYAEHAVIDPELFRNLLVIDEKGAVVQSQTPRAVENHAEREYFRFHESNVHDRLYIGVPMRDGAGSNWVIPVTRRITLGNGTFGGLVLILIDPEYFINFYRRTSIGRDGLVDIVGLDGVSRARQAGSVKAFGAAMAGSTLLQAGAQNAVGNFVSAGKREGVPRFISYRTLKDYPLMVAVGVGRDGVLAPLEDGRRNYIFGAVVANIMLAGFALVLVASLVRQKNSLDALARSEARFRATFNQAAIGISQTLLDGRFLQVNQAFCRLLGYEEHELLGLTHQDIAHPDEVDDSIELRAQFLAGKGSPAAVERRYRHKDGSEIWVAISTALVRDADGAPDYFVSMIECITERKRLQENLEFLACHDGLTRLPNRVLFYNRLQHALEQARRRGWRTGVMFIDLDRFKSINDTLGHRVGDQLLLQVARRLRSCVRAEDTVGRLGGDEFAVILTELSEETSAGIVAKKILESMDRPFQLERHEVFITTSIGISTSAPGDVDVDTMISNADAAMYDAKKLGRNNFQYYAATMSERAMEKLLLEKELRYAISRNEFLLNFQPKVNLDSGEITGFEALLRWHRTGGEIVSPAIFIPVVEDCGLIEEVGEWVLRSACAQLRAWKTAGIRPVPVAVNLSPKQFQHSDIGDMVLRALRDYDIEPDLIELEITESAAMNNAADAIAALTNLKSLGLRIAIDDFGTGYSSLSYLTRFPIDSLKIDRSFVIDLPDSQEGASIARAVITMAHALHLKVIAEGVETLAQLEFLAANACDEIQGYYCSRPVPAAQATALLSGTRHLITRPQLVSAAA